MDPVAGNAGYSDWRLPSAVEMYKTIDPRVSVPPLADKNGEVDNGRYLEQGGEVKGGYNSGMQFSDPLLISADDFGNFWGMPSADPRYLVHAWGTSTVSSAYSDSDGVFKERVIIGMGEFFESVIYGEYCNYSIWPVRGGQP